MRNRDRRVGRIGDETGEHLRVLDGPLPVPEREADRRAAHAARGEHRDACGAGAGAPVPARVAVAPVVFASGMPGPPV